MNIAETCFDNSIRAEKILWLACQTDQYTDAMREFFTDDMSAENLTAIFNGAVKFTEEDLDEATSRWGVRLDDHIGDFVSRLYRAGKRGFLFQAAMPVPQDFHPCEDGTEGITTHGFGHYTTQWFYTDSLDEAFIERLLVWKTEFTAKCREKHAAKKAKTEAV